MEGTCVRAVFAAVAVCFGGGGGGDLPGSMKAAARTSGAMVAPWLKATPARRPYLQKQSQVLMSQKAATPSFAYFFFLFIYTAATIAPSKAAASTRGDLFFSEES
jgi:hypothetical protein